MIFPLNSIVFSQIMGSLRSPGHGEHAPYAFHFPVDDEVNVPLLEALQPLILSTPGSKNESNPRLVFPFTESSVVERGKKRFVCLPEETSTWLESSVRVPNGLALWLDQSALSTLRFCVGNGLIEGQVVIEASGEARIEFNILPELFTVAPRQDGKPLHQVQRLVQILRWYPGAAVGVDVGVDADADVGYQSGMGETLRDNVFREVKPVDWTRECEDPEGLQCSLYSYQRRALAWMLFREGDRGFGDVESVKAKRYPSIRNVPIAGIRGSRVMYDFHANVFTESPVLEKQPLGGILCDEMGLGKTVEMLALILASKREESVHRRSRSDDDRLCGGTLIVVPPALLQQWVSEIHNHSPGLNVEVYNGIRHELDRNEKKKRLMVESDMDRLDMAYMRRQVSKFFTGLSGKRLEGVTDDMVREAYFNTLRATGKLPVEDPTELVMTEARRLAVADVVITTFDVLKMEVDYDASKNERRLRHPKRYLVPDCALLKVNFFRMVADEAQMIGSFGAVAEMTEKIVSGRRWCVTGTPMVSLHELCDLKSLLQFLGMIDAPFASAWQRLIQPGFSPKAPRAARDASWEAMKRALVPLMWRTDKQTVRGEITLPSRALHFVPLRFFPGESELYAQLVENVAHAHTALEVATESLKAMKNERASSKRSHEKKVDKLQEEERQSVLQLRLACIHPQLTSFWKREMSSDLQIGSGGSASMMEVLKRLVDKEQGDLQEAERNLCSYVNTLAMRLCDQGDVLRKREMKLRGRGEKIGEKSGEKSGEKGENEPSQPPGALSPTPSLQSPEKKNPFGLSTSEEHYLKAQELLLLSKRVGNKGIRALDLTWEDAQKLPEPEASAASSWSAWQRLQINTNRQLIRVLEALGIGGEERDKLEVGNVKRKMDFVESAQKELDAHAATLAKLTEKAIRLREQIFDLMKTGNGHFNDWGAIQDPIKWWERHEDALNQARELETQQLEAQTSTTEAILGTAVTSYLSEVEKEIRMDLTPLEAHVSRGKIRQAIDSLESHELSDVDWVAENALAVPMKELRYLMGRFAALLSPFKRDTILNQYSLILPVPRSIMVDENLDAVVKTEGDKGGLNGTGPSGPTGASTTANSVPNESTAPTAPTMGVGVVLLEESLGYSKPVDSSDPAILEAAAHHDEFIPAASFTGRVKGYAFYMGDKGLGYHVDARSSSGSPQSTPISYMMSQCHSKLLHDLRQRFKSLTKSITSNPVNEKLFDSLDYQASGRTAIEKRLSLTIKLLDHVRATRDAHIASGQVRLKNSALHKCEEDVEDAANDYPIKTLRQLDKIIAKIDENKSKALAIQHKKAFMQNQINTKADQRNDLASEETAEAGTIVELKGEVEAGGDDHGKDADPAHQTIDTDRDISKAKDASGTQCINPSPSPAKNYGPARVQAAGGANEFECPVCLSVAQEELCLFSTCGHAFCRDCSDQLFRFTKSATCPICRNPCSHRSVLRVAAHEPSHGQGHDGGDREHDPTASDDPIVSTIVMRSAWSIKIWAVVRRVLALQQTAPSEKSLVFSQFSEALRVVSLALKAHEVPHVQLLGRSKDVGQAVNAFREDENVKVFLVAHKAGAQGLTLVRANHVFLLEPSVDPSIEQQAISRVHRIGQQRAVNIYRPCIKDTIEEKVLNLQKRRQNLLSGDHDANEAAEDDDGAGEYPEASDEFDDDEEDNLLGQADGNTATTLTTPVTGEVVTDLENTEMVNALLLKSNNSLTPSKKMRHST